MEVLVVLPYVRPTATEGQLRLVLDVCITVILLLFMVKKTCPISGRPPQV